MSVLLVGEDNPYGADPRFALYHLPPHASGGRLMRLVLGLREETYESLAKINLCSEKWSMRQARLAAERVQLTESVEGDPCQSVVVILGRKVADAFRYDGGPVSWQYRAAAGGRGLVLVSLPHPSGLNRSWNDRGLPERCREVLRSQCPSVPWGEAL